VPCHPLGTGANEPAQTRTLVRSYMYCQPPRSRYIDERLDTAGCLSFDSVQTAAVPLVPVSVSTVRMTGQRSAQPVERDRHRGLARPSVQPRCW
jgi:hypothetical protein